MENHQISILVNVNSDVMRPPKPTETIQVHKGFSLIELLIVIAIISLFGFMVFGSMKKSELKPKPYSIKNLKKVFKTSSDAELVCVDKCTQCFVITTNHANTQKVKSDLKKIEAYILDSDDSPQKIDFGRMNDHPICLRFHYYTNGSTSQIILESEEKFFYFPSYFGKISIHDSLDDAADTWIQNTKLLTSKGNYY